MQELVQKVRRFKVVWSEIDDTLDEGERVGIGILMDQGERTILVEYSPAIVNGQRVRADETGWRRVLHDGKEQHATNIPGQAAREFLDTCQRRVLIDRYRYHGNDGLVWTINRFLDANEPLVLAEVDVSGLRTGITFPRFVHPGNEVTNDTKYDVYRLASNPFKRWK